MFKYQKQSKSLCNGLMEGLGKLDVFGLPPNFRILKQQKFATNLGLICSLVSFIICLYYIQAELSDLLSYTNPSVVMSEIQPKNGVVFMNINEPLPLTKNNFTFVLTVTDNSLNSLSSYRRYFNLTLIQSIRQRRINESGNLVIDWNLTQIPMEVCSPEKHFVNDYQKEYFSKFKLDHMYCFESDFWEKNPPYLQGHSQADKFAILTVNLNKCRNSTNYNGCAPEEEIQANMKSGFYVLYMSDTLAQMNLPGRPYEDIITLQYTPFSISQSSQVSSIMKVSETATDYGLFKKDYQMDQALQQENIQTVTSPYNSQYLVQNLVFFEQRQSYFQRSYLKIQTILGSVGGLWKFITSFIAFILYPILFTSLNLSMAKKLFSFENNTSFENQIHDMANVLAFSNLGRSDALFEQNTQRITAKTKIKSQERDITKLYIDLKKFLKQKKSFVLSGVVGALKYMFGWRNHNQRQLKYAMDQILKKMDVCYLLQKLSELDKLKDILLTKEQLALFNYIPKPLIPQNTFQSNLETKIDEIIEKKEYQFIIREEKAEIHKIIDAYNAFIALKKEENPSIIDYQILQCLDDDIRQLFEKVFKMQQESQMIQDKVIMTQILSPKSNDDILLNPEPPAQKIKRFLNQ